MEFTTNIGVNHDCELGLLLFSIVVDESLENTKKTMKTI